MATTLLSTTPDLLLLHLLPKPLPPFPTPLFSPKPKPTTFRLFSTGPNHPPPSPSLSDIDMVKNPQGIYSAKPKKVVVLWDLDNKPPRGPPYQAALSLKTLAQRFGDSVEISAYANRHAFIHLPQWVIQQRRDQRHLNVLERKGIVTPPQPYVCGVCGRKCKTSLDLTKHFKQLHERERQKKVNRMRSLKGKKRQKYREKFVSGNVKYEEAARELIRPKVGYGLANELRRAGVFVKTVEDKPQAADWAVKKQMQHSMSRGVDWLFLVSDDSDFGDMLRRARSANLRTVVVGDWDRALGRFADLWVPWSGVENGEIGEEELRVGGGTRGGFSDGNGDDEELFSLTEFDEDGDCGSDLDQVVEELVVANSRFEGGRVSAFSEGEDEEEWERDEIDGESGGSHVGGSLHEKDLFWDSDEEDMFI